MNDPAVRSHVDKWLAAHPAQRLSLPFIAAPRRDLYLALAALEQELVSAAYGIREPHVAATKLNWWAEELGGAVVGGGRHPLVQALFADAGVRALAPELWLAPPMAALQQLEAGTPADFPAQLAAAAPFHGALATLETRLWFGPDADPARATRVASLDHLLQRLTRLEAHADDERLPLPMSRLARHGLDRDSLGRDDTSRRDAVHAQIIDLIQAWHEAMRLPGPLSTFRGLDARLGRHWLQTARRAGAPVKRRRAAQTPQTGFGTLRRAWSAARASRGEQLRAGID